MPDAIELEPSTVTTPADRRWHLDLIPFRPYVYRGLGYDIYTGEDDGE